MQTPLAFFFAFVVVLALIGLAAWLVRRFAGNRLGANANRGRMPRLAVIDAAAVDGRRRLVLVRRDNVEHLLMIGGPSDIVVEQNIVRAMPAPRSGPAAAQRGGRIAAAGRPCPMSATGPTATHAPDHAEPAMPEPPPRPARPSFADEVRRPAPALSERRGNDLSSGLSPEPTLRPEPRPETRDPMASRPARSEPLIPRPSRPIEPPKAPAGPRAGTRRGSATAAATFPGTFGGGSESRRDGAAAGSSAATAGRRFRRTARRRAAGGTRAAAGQAGPRPRSPHPRPRAGSRI